MITSPALPSMMMPFSVAFFVYLRSVTWCSFLFALQMSVNLRSCSTSLAVSCINGYFLSGCMLF